MEYVRFENEDDFLKEILQRITTGKVYPRVTSIAGSRIKPDIDILEIKKGYKNQNQLIGYELKLIKYHKGIKGLSWDAFYKGIGQTLMYLHHGLHRGVLLIGFPSNIKDDVVIDDFHKMLWDGRENIFPQILGPHISIATYLYERGHINCEVQSKSDYWPSNDKITLSRQNLLNENFTHKKLGAVRP